MLMDIALTEQRVRLAGTLRGAATILPGPARADSPPSGSCPLPHSLPSLPLSLSPPLSSFGHLWAGFWSGWVAWWVCRKGWATALWTSWLASIGWSKSELNWNTVLNASKLYPQNGPMADMKFGILLTTTIKYVVSMC